MVPRFSKEYLMASGKDGLYPPLGESEISVEVFNLSNEAKSGEIEISGAVEQKIKIDVPAMGKAITKLKVTPKFPKDDFKSNIIYNGK